MGPKALRAWIARAFFGRIIQHRRALELPPLIRRRIYAQLIDLIDEESRVQETLDLPVGPRLNVVDETRVAILRPTDRVAAFNDPEYEAAKRAARSGSNND